MKLFAGRKIRRLRQARGLSQAAMAEMLAISPSYVNLIERDQRPVPAALLLRLGGTFDFDPRELGREEPGGGADAIRTRLADPRFADLDIDRTELEDWLAAAPGTVAAFARAFDALDGAGPATTATTPVDEVRAQIERWHGHYPDLDAAAEALADDLRLTSADLDAAIAERLRITHKLSIRVLPIDVMPAALRRTDLHARQLQLSELLDRASRTFAGAFQLGQLEARSEVEALVKGAALSDRSAERLYRRHLTSYFAAAVMMPYARFLRACEATGYDVELLQRRFGAGFEQVAHRFTTLQRTGARGLPFFLLRIDRAGQVSKRFAGASASPIVASATRCPLWRIHDAFATPTQLVTDLATLEDGSRWFAMARTVAPQGARIGGVEARFAVVLGLAADLAPPLAAARGIDLKRGAATPIGLGCPACTRHDCPQRSAPPAGRPPRFDDDERALSAWGW